MNDRIQINDEKLCKKSNYFCELCNISFSRKDRLDRHVFIHTGIRAYKCKQCDKSYTNSFHLKRHMKSHDSLKEVSSYICEYPDCFQNFSNFSNMNRHYKLKHETPLPYRCDHCQKETRFHRKHQLRRHLKVYHDIGDYVYQCDKCESGFFNKFSYTKHLATHKSKKCDSCDMTFANWTQLVNHRKEEHTRRIKNSSFECDLCGKIFCRKPNLKEHMRIHLMKDIVYMCSFEDCSKFYTNKRNLYAHIRSKHEGKKFVCDICNVKLSTKQKLDFHKAAHEDPVRAQNIKKSKVSFLLGIKVHKQNLSNELLDDLVKNNRIDGVTTESE